MARGDTAPRAAQAMGMLSKDALLTAPSDILGAKVHRKRRIAVFLYKSPEEFKNKRDLFSELSCKSCSEKKG